MLHMFAGFETAKKPKRNGEKTRTKRRKKTRAQNVETETAKKTGNSEKFGNRR